MVEQQQRSLIMVGRVQAILNAGFAVAIFAAYVLDPGLLSSVFGSLTSAIIGVAAVVYFLTFHQIIGRTRLSLSTLILTSITAINFVAIIATTGGLDSPYYSLWLLAIVAAGIFGTVEILVVLGLTGAYYLGSFFLENFSGPYIRDHIVQLIISLIAGGLAEWVHRRSWRATAQKSKLDSLSGKLSEEQLKAQALMSSIGEGVVVINSQRQIQLFNKAAQQLTGWDESSAQGIDYNLVLQLRDAKDKELTDGNDPFSAAWQAHEQVVRDNLTMVTRSGHKLALNISVSPMFDGAGQATGAIALFRDITKEKALERQKDEFVSTASHEMRTPVAAIEGYISLAMNANVATVDDRAAKYLEKAHETITHLGELFRDLLSVTKAEEGQLNAKIEPVNLAQLLQSAVDDMQFTAQKKNLTLILQVSSSTGRAIAPMYYVAANPERLREVVMNLIDNAIKFTSQGGVTVTMTGNDKETEVAISDTGVGIAQEDMAHLFQKFYRIDNSATRTIGGTGLGLYLCRTVIELFNGRIWVTSRMGQGSTFHFMLPRLAEEEAKRMLQRLETPVTAGGSPKPVVPIPGMVVEPHAPEAGPAITGVPIAMPVPGEQLTREENRHTVQ